MISLSSLRNMSCIGVADAIGHPLPCVSHRSSSGIGSGDVGELAVKGVRRRPAVHPLHLRGGRGQRRVAGLPRAVDDEAHAGQRLEGGGDGAVRIEIMDPGEAAAQSRARRPARRMICRCGSPVRFDDRPRRGLFIAAALATACISAPRRTRCVDVVTRPSRAATISQGSVLRRLPTLGTGQLRTNAIRRSPAPDRYPPRGRCAGHREHR